MKQSAGSSGRVAFTVRLPEDLHRRLRVFVAERGLDLQDAGELAYRRLVEDTASDRLGLAAGETRAAALLFLEFFEGAGVEARGLLLDALRAWRARR